MSLGARGGRVDTELLDASPGTLAGYETRWARFPLDEPIVDLLFATVAVNARTDVGAFRLALRRPVFITHMIGEGSTPFAFDGEVGRDPDVFTPTLRG